MRRGSVSVVRFGSGRNKFVQLLIRSQNSSGRFVRSLGTVAPSVQIYLQYSVYPYCKNRLFIHLSLAIFGAHKQIADLPLAPTMGQM